MGIIKNIKSSIDQSDSDNIIGGRRWILLLGIFLISSGMLAFEVMMTRILSVVLSYHYVFAVISLALLGLGLGAVFSHLFRKRLDRLSKFSSLALMTAILAFSIPISILVIARVANSDLLDSVTFLYLLLITIPFFVSGILFAELFRTYSRISSQLYGMDLLGAALGAVGAIIALNTLGGTKALIVIGLLVVAAAILYFIGTIKQHVCRYLILTTGLLIIFSLAGTATVNSSLAQISIGSQDKEMAAMLANPNARIVETKWNAFGRTDLVASDNDPSQMVIFTDGTAGASMYQFNGDTNNPNTTVREAQDGFAGYLALSNMPENEKNTALIIGPGGGRDVLMAQTVGVKQITAVEVNQATVDIVRKYSQYNGGIYNAPNVAVVVDEGRNFLKRQDQKYDIIMLSIPLTKTSRSLEGFALTENYLFTTDSINDYLNHLSDNGRLLVVAHDQIETVKLLSLSLSTLNQRGIDNESAMKQVAVIGNHMFPAFILKKTPLTSSEAITLHQSIHELGFDPSMSFVPDIQVGKNVSHLSPTTYNQCSSFNQLLVEASQGKLNFNDLDKEATASGIDIRPVTDNNPFFYKFETGIPQSVTLVFWLSLITLAVVSVVFFNRGKNGISEHGNRRVRSSLVSNLLRFTILFSMLGIGFMLVEVSIFQKLTLFLGQPVLSLAVMLASLLMGAGLGSLFSNRFAPEQINRVLSRVSMIIVVILLIYALALPIMLNQLLGLELNLRLLTSVLVLLPLGFFMGFPFPLGIRLLKEEQLESGIPWVWGINGIGSVVGSAFTIMIAISSGFTTALILGAVCYLVVLAMFFGKRKLNAA